MHLTDTMFYPFFPIEILPTVLYYCWILNEPCTLKLSITSVYHFNQNGKDNSKHYGKQEERNGHHCHHCVPLNPSHRGDNGQKIDNVPEFHSFPSQPTPVPCGPPHPPVETPFSNPLRVACPLGSTFRRRGGRWLSGLCYVKV